MTEEVGVGSEAGYEQRQRNDRQRQQYREYLVHKRVQE
jgi:hypothetical protein